MEAKIGVECKVVVDLIIFYFFSGKTPLVNFSRFVKVVRKTDSIMKHCNFLYLIVKEEQHGRPKTLCRGTNENQKATQNIMMLFNSVLFHAFLLIFVIVLKFFPFFHFPYFVFTLPYLTNTVTKPYYQQDTNNTMLATTIKFPSCTDKACLILCNFVFCI